MEKALFLSNQLSFWGEKLVRRLGEGSQEEKRIRAFLWERFDPLQQMDNTWHSRDRSSYFPTVIVDVSVLQSVPLRNYLSVILQEKFPLTSQAVSHGRA